jgi:hypothetical protein
MPIAAAAHIFYYGKISKQQSKQYHKNLWNTLLHKTKAGELPSPIEADGFLVNISIETSLPKLKRMFHPRIITSYIASFTRFLLAFISLS